MIAAGLSLACASATDRTNGNVKPAVFPPHSIDSVEPPWRNDVILWHGELGNDTPWRSHSDLSEYTHSAEYPDDVQVAIQPPETRKWEIVWSQVIGFHPRSGEYLARLLNEPNAVPSISKGDNLAFKIVAKASYPVAIDRGKGYALAAYPEFAPKPFANALVSALRAYRQGNMGHAPEYLHQAIPLFELAIKNATEETNATADFYAHFYLGRCHAELYNTEDAMEAFAKALEYRDSDPNARMALLAEYSILAVSDSDVALEYRQRFVEEEAAIRELFPIESGSIHMLDTIYENLATTGTPVETLAGKATFRWKAK